MIKAIIRVEGKYFVGEDLENTHKIKNGSLASGFSPNYNKEVNQLIWSENKDEAYEALGARGIKSVLDKLEQRERLGILPKGFNFKIQNI